MAELIIEKILTSRKNNYIATESEGSIRYIIYNRAEKSNAFTLEMYQKLEKAITAANKDQTIKFIVIYGKGKNYTTGNDLANFLDP